MRYPQFALLLDQDLVKRESRHVDFTLLGGLDNAATRFIDMRAIVELAGADKRPEIGHRVSDIVVRQMHQAERLQAR